MSPSHQPLRKHQREALAQLTAGWAGEGHRRAWVVLPPGAGKTRLGLEAVAHRLTEQRDLRAVVLAPNTAIQAQWIVQAQALGLDASDDKQLTASLTCLTYQSLAVFDSEPDAEPEPDAEAPKTGSLVNRLHPNGVALFDRIKAQPQLLLILDECHHLLEVWGQLLAELLHSVDTAHVLALTATPPDSLTVDQATLVKQLFGDILYRVSVPAVVREGHLAPFDELVWLTTPTPAEEDWLAEEAARFTELTAMLTRPGFGSLGFYEWLTQRFVDPIPATTTWQALAAREPELCDAALRMHHAELLALPHDARVGEPHRHDPTADDWARLLGEWLLTHVAKSDDPADAEVIAAVRAALPAVGYQWTKRGPRRGRSIVDRVLARSAAKSLGAVQIVAAEHRALGERLRAVVLCDFERATATVPLGLEGVLEAQSGSAISALQLLLDDPATAILHPVLVTGRLVAGDRDTLTDLVEFVATRDPALAARLQVEDGPDGLAVCTTGWSSRVWVGHLTAFFEAGLTQVLVGTRGLLGEGWDARSISTLVDLTAATTLTAVVQTRGRAMRIDPTWPDKVATTWTVVCVTEAHPNGANDWSRLVRKHQGFYGVDHDGDIVDGVAHIDASFSPFAPPPVADFDRLNAAMLLAAENRDAIRQAWQIGEPYRDLALPTLRVRRPATPTVAADPAASGEVVTLTPTRLAFRLDDTHGLQVVEGPPATDWRAAWGVTAGSATALAGAMTLTQPWAALVVGGAGALASATQAVRTLGRQHTAVSAWVDEQLARTRVPPTLEAVAAAVADALLGAGLSSVGADALTVEVHPGAEYRFVLSGTTGEADLFATAFDEAIGPVTNPRYLVSRFSHAALPETSEPWTRGGALKALRQARPTAEVWHPVPTALGRNVKYATAYHRAWTDWVGAGRLLAAARPEGAGVLAAVHGEDPFAVTTVIRRHWS